VFERERGENEGEGERKREREGGRDDTTYTTLSNTNRAELKACALLFIPSISHSER